MGQFWYNIVSVLLILTDIATGPSLWQGVLVNPLEKAYEKPPEKEPTVEEMEVSATET